MSSWMQRRHQQGCHRASIHCLEPSLLVVRDTDGCSRYMYIICMYSHIFLAGPTVWIPYVLNFGETCLRLHRGLRKPSACVQVDLERTYIPPFAAKTNWTTKPNISWRDLHTKWNNNTLQKQGLNSWHETFKNSTWSKRFFFGPRFKKIPISSRWSCVGPFAMQQGERQVQLPSQRNGFFTDHSLESGEVDRMTPWSNGSTRWWFFSNIFVMFIPKIGEDDSHFDEYFSNGLVQPPTSSEWHSGCHLPGVVIRISKVAPKSSWNFRRTDRRVHGQNGDVG